MHARLPPRLPRLATQPTNQPKCAHPIPSSCCLRPLASAAVSSLCVWGLLVVVGIVVLRSAEIVSAPGHSWEAVRAINSDSPLEFLSALVIFVFGFHVRWLAGWLGVAGALTAAGVALAQRQGVLCSSALGHQCLVRNHCCLQSHTNVVSIFEELEAQPSLFRSGTSTPSLAGSEAVLGSAADAVAAAGAATACGGAANGFSRSSRQRRPKSEKLLGMIHVVMAGLAVTAVLYTCVGALSWGAWGRFVAGSGKQRLLLARPPGIQAGALPFHPSSAPGHTSACRHVGLSGLSSHCSIRHHAKLRRE